MFLIPPSYTFGGWNGTLPLLIIIFATGKMLTENKVVTHLEDLIGVFVVRGIVFVEEQGVLSIANQKTSFYLSIN